MSPASTRFIAAGILVAVLVLSAGCGALQNGSTPTDELVLVNQDDVDHAVVVEITDGENLVYSAGRTLEPESDTRLNSFAEDGEYQLAVTVDGESTISTFSFPSDDSAVTIGIDNAGNVTVET